MTELIQTLAALTMIGALALIFWSGYRQDHRRKAERAAAQAERLAALRAKADADWKDMCRQTRSVDEAYCPADAACAQRAMLAGMPQAILADAGEEAHP